MKSKTGHWIYDGEDFDVNDYFGFIYIITNQITGKKYLGRKFFHVHQKRKRVRESPWRTYMGSCKPLSEDIKTLGKANFTFEIFRLYTSRGGLSYFETYHLAKNDVLTQRDDEGERTWYNNHIGAVKWIAPFEVSEATRYKLSVAKTDADDYHFRNKDGRVHRGTRLSLREKDSAVNTRGLSKLLRKKQKTHKGWYEVK
tara:strand:+ start:7627 stop:8223 length:597 start_codon:yes stop_codon:yes gene_type:complete